jgi:hypothetical protein
MPQTTTRNAESPEQQLRAFAISAVAIGHANGATPGRIFTGGQWTPPDALRHASPIFRRIRPLPDSSRNRGYLTPQRSRGSMSSCLQRPRRPTATEAPQSSGALPRALRVMHALIARPRGPTCIVVQRSSMSELRKRRSMSGPRNDRSMSGPQKRRSMSAARKRCSMGPRECGRAERSGRCGG